MKLTGVSIFMFCTLLPYSIGEGLQEEKKKILGNLLKNHDSDVRPEGTDGKGPVKVFVDSYLRNVEISDKDREMKVQLILRSTWNDPRLNFLSERGEIEYLPKSNNYMIWMPDLFFQNERSGYFHNIILPNMMTRIYPDGGVLYSIRLSLNLDCPMNFANFPFDTQVCEIRLASYGFHTEDMIVLWKNSHAVHVPSDLSVPNFLIKDVNLTSNDQLTVTGNYSRLVAKVYLKRLAGYYTTHWFIPCFMMVVISYLTFWLDQTITRVFLSSAAIFVFEINNILMYKDIPTVSYTKAIDVYTGVCMIFMFGTLVEVVIVSYVARNGKKQNNQPIAEDVEDNAQDSELKTGDSKLLAVLPKFLAKTFPTSKTHRIDVIARIVYPIAFAIFALAFFTSYSN